MNFTKWIIFSGFFFLPFQAHTQEVTDNPAHCPSLNFVTEHWAEVIHKQPVYWSKKEFILVTFRPGSEHTHTNCHIVALNWPASPSSFVDVCAYGVLCDDKLGDMIRIGRQKSE
jgi:hypothetical protein